MSDLLLMATPDSDGALWRVNIPQIDVLGLTSNGDPLTVLPLNFHSLEVGINLCVVELTDLLARVCTPNMNYT